MNLERINELLAALTRQRHDSELAKAVADELLALVWQQLESAVRRLLAAEYDRERNQKWTATLLGRIHFKLLTVLLGEAPSAKTREILTAADLFRSIGVIARYQLMDVVRHEHNLYRRLERKAASQPADSWLLQEADMVARLERLDRFKQLAEALGQLPEDLSEVLMLHYYQELTFPQIADILATSTGSVKHRHRAAVGWLRELLGDAFPSQLPD